MSRHSLYNDRNDREPGVNTMRGWDHRRFSNDNMYSRLVGKAAHYYDNMRSLRKKWFRDLDYYMGRQLEDTVVYNGRRMSVKTYMEMKGMPALSADIITDKMISLKGIVRQQYMTPSIKSVDSNETDYIGIFNELLRQNCNNNNKAEHDADQFEMHSALGFVCDKVKWAFRYGREDVYVDKVDPFKLAVPLFDRKDLEDVEFIAEAHDVTWPQMLKHFVKETGDEKQLVNIYTNARADLPIQGYNDTGMNQSDHLDDFYHSSVVGKYRFIELWTLERNRALWCHDRLNASAGYRPLTDKEDIDAENERRRQDNIMKDENGVVLLDEQGMPRHYIPEENLQLIEYEYGIEEFWYYRMLSPNGYLLDEGISPYKVLRDGYSFYYHPYVFLAYPCIQGEVRSFIDRLIDRQRMYNHDNILLDFIIMNSSKGALAIDEESLTDEMGIEEIAENYVKVDGLILYTSKKGAKPPVPLQNKSLPAGIDLILQRDRELITSQSGIQPAMQGVHVGSNTSEGRYRMEKEGSATSISDYIGSFNNFTLRVARKQMWTIQWFYDDLRSVKITGQDIRKYFNRSTMSDIDFDMALTMDINSAVVRESMKDLAWQAYLRDEVNFGQCIDSADFGDTAKLRQFWQEHLEEKRQQAMAANIGMQQPAAQGNKMDVPGGTIANRTNGAERLLQSGTDSSTGAVAGSPGLSS